MGTKSSENWINCEIKNSWQNDCQTTDSKQCLMCPPGPRGPAGVSVVGCYIHDDDLYIQLSNAQRLNVGKCVGDKGDQGEPGVFVTAAVVRDGYLWVYLSDGTEINAGYVLAPEKPIESNILVKVTPGDNVFTSSISRSVVKNTTGNVIVNFMVLPITPNIPLSFTFEWDRNFVETSGEPAWFVYSAENDKIQCKWINERKFEIKFTPSTSTYHRISFNCV
jgi:hypothetical protein